MKKFVKSLSVSVLYGIINFVIFLLLFYAIIFYKSYRKRYKPKKNNFLLLEFVGDMYENPMPSSILDRDNKNLSFLKIKECIKYAAQDSTISGIKIKIGKFKAGFAHLEELRKALENFKKSKKTLVAYSTIYFNKAYYLSSIADKIYLHPEGMFIWAGMAINKFFYKKLFDKLKIQPIEYHVGKYKSFGETYYKTQMSPESKEQLSEIIFSVYDDLLEKVSKARNLNIYNLRKLAQDLEVFLPKDALRCKLVDELGYEDDVNQYIKKKDNIKKNEKINYVGINKYYQYLIAKKKNCKINKICVLIAEGQIRTGKSNKSDVIGSKDFIKTIKAIKKDKTVKAIVLRINSPGGSVIASDEIWHALKQLKKPIITSMSNVAASGGYYMASATDYIFADKNTITGSIGVLMLLFKTDNLLKDYLGITNDIIKTEPYADVFGMTTPGLQRNLQKKEKQFFNKFINHHYNGFIKKVSDCRKLSIKETHNRSQGRVWIGNAALKMNLVDKIGGLDDAISLAVEKAKLKGKKYSICYLPRKKLFLEMIFEGMTQKIIYKIASIFGIKIKQKNLPNIIQGPQYLMPYELSIN